MSQSPFKIRARTPADADWVRARFVEEWYGDYLVLDGRRVYADEIPAIVAVRPDGRQVGFLGWRMKGSDAEIIALLATDRYEGIGSALVEEFVRFSRAEGAKRVLVATTNDNVDALRFYQRRGFRLARLHAGAIEMVRQDKPDIPAEGDHGIPLRDVIELEREL